MGRLWQIAQRALLLVLIWGVAAAVVVQAACSFITHQRLVRDATAMRADYDKKLADYAAQLAEGERLKHDKQYQVELLKQRFGYTRPNETPIIVEDETESAAAATGAAQ